MLIHLTTDRATAKGEERMICKHIKFDRYAERLNADGRCDIWNWHCGKQLQSICKVLRDERAEQNIQIHELKLELEFCDEVERGVKPFEIRFNDRNYKKLSNPTILECKYFYKIIQCNAITPF